MRTETFAGTAKGWGLSPEMGTLRQGGWCWPVVVFRLAGLSDSQGHVAGRRWIFQLGTKTEVSAREKDLRS